MAFITHTRCCLFVVYGINYTYPVLFIC